MNIQRINTHHWNVYYQDKTSEIFVFRLYQLGFVNYFLLLIRATVIVGDNASFQNLGAWGLIDRIQLKIGKEYFIDVSGYALAYLQKVLHLDGISDMISSPIQTGKNLWMLPLFLPFTDDLTSSMTDDKYYAKTLALNLLTLSSSIDVTIQVDISNEITDYIINGNYIEDVNCELYQYYFESLDIETIQRIKQETQLQQSI